MKPEYEAESALNSLEKKLNNPKAKIEGITVHTVTSNSIPNTASAWQDSPVIQNGIRKESSSFGLKIFLASLLIFAIAVAFTAWRVMSSRNVVSSANIDMSIDVKQIIEGGQATPLVVTLQNKNAVILEDALLILSYKQGNGPQDEQEKVQEKKPLGTVNAQDFKKQDFVITLYGSEAEPRDISVTLQYKVRGSNAVFNKVISSSVVLTTSPIAIRMDGPQTLSPNQVGAYTVTITNNTSTTSSPAVFTLTLPRSFAVTSSSPSPLAKTTTWSIPPIVSGKAYSISFSGSATAATPDKITFRAVLGSVGRSAGDIGIVFSDYSFDTIIRESLLTTKVSLETERNVGESLLYGDKATIIVTYTNTSASVLQNGEIVLTLAGDAALYEQVANDSGYYDSQKKTITWNKDSLPELALIQPKYTGSIKVRVPIVLRGNNTPALTATVKAAATQQTINDTTTSVSKSWNVQGSATVLGVTQYAASSFKNTGPIPPQPNVETTYTIRLSVSAQNSLQNAQVTFSVPVYMTWKGQTTDSANINYTSRTRTVTWNIGAIQQGVTKTADITLGIIPSQSQVGQSPQLTSIITLNADEEISRAHIKTTTSPVTTYLNGEVWPVDPSKVVAR